MKNTKLYLRIIGGLSVIGGAILLWFGGKEISINLPGNTSISPPLEYIFIVIGLLLLFLPLLFIYTLALVLPEKWEKRLLEYADSLDPEFKKIKEDPNPQNIATLLHSHIHRANKRSYILILVAVLFMCVALPLLVQNAITLSQAKRESERLVSLVQETRIDFVSSDYIRTRLHEAEGGMTHKPNAATRQIYDVLKKLYDPSIKSKATFSDAINQIYEERIKQNVTEDGLLRIEKFKFDKHTSESALAPATYLTLLALICNMVGAQGRHVDPYIQGRQLLKLTSSYYNNDKDKVPATHNVSGVNFAGLLTSYPKFEEKFRDAQVARNLQSSLGINGIPSQLSLLRQAKAEYTAAAQQSPTNLAKARSINNQVDVLLTFLYRIHLDKQWDPQMIRDDTDRLFLENELAMKLPEKSVNTLKLVEILNGFNNRLNEAIELAPEPEIYFTRAQLLSVGGKLGEEYKLTDGYWGASDKVASDAVSNLSFAQATRRLPTWSFEESAAEQFHLKWLWDRPNRDPRLEKLAHP